MKKLKYLIGTALMIAMAQANAVSISLVPSLNKIHSGETLFLDVNISGLHSGGTNSLLGGWSMDIGFDPGVLQPTLFSSTGPYLGSIAQGQAIEFPSIDFSVPGLISLGELSLLPIDNYFDTAWNPGLDCVQRQPQCDPGNSNPGGSPLDFFTLATITFQLANSNTAFPGQYTSINTQNIILSDGFGDEISVASHPNISVQVPEPSVILLLCIGLIPLSLKFKFGKLANLNDHSTLEIKGVNRHV